MTMGMGGAGVVRTDWESHGYVSGEGIGRFLAGVNGDSLIGTRGELPSFSLNAFKSLSGPSPHTQEGRDPP